MLQKIAIHGVPRSGTTWLGEILNSNEQVIYKYQPLFSYAFKSYLDDKADAARIAQFFAAIANTEDAFLDQSEQRARGDLPVFKKSTPTHIVYKEVRYHHILANLLAQDTSVRLIALVRNPLAVMASWLAAPREFRQDLGWVFADEWRHAPSKNENKPEDFYGFEKWKEAAHLFHVLAAQYPQRVKLLSYSALLAHPEEETRRLCEFANLNFSAQMQTFLQSSRAETKADAYAVFRQRQQDDGWRAVLDKNIVNVIRADLQGSDLACYLDEN
ncbi:MAG: sulfotransferase domain-containing protein [Cellvibrionales bacterium]|nr:sulfotransferase domain-containing protein [Cellvibrionales bacterium]